MIPRFILQFRRFTIFRKLAKRDLENMDKAYFRQCDDQLQITLSYTITDGGINRQFNFSRKLNENVETLTNRIRTNLDKIICKKKAKNFKKNPQVSPNFQPSIVQLFLNDEIVAGEVGCKTLLNSGGTLHLQLNELKYEVIINAPWIDAITLPSSVLAGFPVYPSKFEGVYMDKQFSHFIWYAGQINTKPLLEKWEERSQGYLFIPSVADIGLKLKLICIPGNSQMKGPSIEAITQSSVEIGPGHCPYDTRHNFTQSLLSGRSLRVVSYNILADLYCDADFTRTELFPYCSSYALQIDYRKQLFTKEILGYNGDIVCLQEVDIKIFENDLKPILAEQQFKGIFAKKGGQVTEGLACFFRETRFQLIDSQKIIFGEEINNLQCFIDIWDKIKDNKPLVTRFTEKATAAQAVILRSIENPDEIIVVGNTHLYFHPDSDHIRLLQGGLAIRWLQNIISNLQTLEPNKRVSLIFCGDFNSVPSCGIYQLYTQGFVPDDFVDWKSNAEEAIKGLSLSQDLPLDSACGTPQYTNFTVDFSDCLDYIFYTKKNFSVEQVVPFPSEEELKQYTALPSVVSPSDHLALIADLSFT